MSKLQLVRRAGLNDIKLVARDGFLVMMLSMVVVFGLVLRFGLPWMDGQLAAVGVLPSATIPSRLSDYYAPIVAYMAFYTGALMIGTIIGFVLLDEKDERTIEAMMVTPVPLSWFVLYRAVVPALIAYVVVAAFFLFINQALVPLWQLLLLCVGASLTAPIITLFFATFAENKVQGFAMAKFVGLAGWVILLGWFVPEPLQWLMGLFPPFLVSKAYWMALDGSPMWWMVLVVGIALEMVAILVLIRRFSRRAFH